MVYYTAIMEFKKNKLDLYIQLENMYSFLNVEMVDGNVREIGKYFFCKSKIN